MPIASTLGSMLIELGINSGTFQSDMGKIARVADRTASRMNRVFARAGSRIAAGAAAGASGVAAVGAAAAGSVNRIIDLSRATVSSVDEFSRQELVMKAAGNTLEDYSTLLLRTTRRIGDAARGSEEYQEIFARIGLDYERVADLTPTQQFFELAEAVLESGNAALFMADANKIVEQEGLKPFITTLALGSEKIKEYQMLADLLNNTITPEQAAVFREWRDTTTRMGAAFAGFGRTIASGVLPVLNQLLSGVTGELFVKLGETIVSVFRGIVTGVAAAIAAFKLFIQFINSTFRAAFQLIKGAGESLVASVVLLAEGIKNAFTLNFDEAKASFQDLVEFDAEGGLAKALAEIEREAADLRKGAKQTRDELVDTLFAAFEGGEGDANEFANALQGLIDGQLPDLATEAKETGFAIEDVLDMLRESEDDLQTLANEYAENILKLAEFINAEETTAAEADLARDALKKLGAEFRRLAANIEKPEFDDFIEGLREQNRLIQSNIAWQEVLNAQKQLDTELTEEQVLEILREVEAREDLLKLLQLEASARGKLFGSRGNSFTALIGNAFKEAITSGGMRTFFKEFKEGIAEAWKKGTEEQLQIIREVAEFSAFAVNSFKNSETFLEGLARTLSAIPGPVGDIARAASAVNEIFGGRLFGTGFQTRRSGFNLALDGGGFSGNQFEEQRRRRALFLGTQRRTIISDLDPQFAAELDDLFDNIGAAMVDAAILLGTDLPQLIGGTFEQEFDKDGELVRSVSSILGRTFNETLEEFAARVTAENILAILGQVVPEIEREVQAFRFGEGFGDFGGFFPTGTFTETVSEADAIAERWRDSAFKLLEGAEFLLLAVSTQQRGIELLEETASLTELTNFIEANNRAGETLSETYNRLLILTESYTQFLDTLGLTTSLAREEFVLFAQSLGDFAGGTEQLNNLFKTFFEGFFSAEEQAEILLRQSETVRNDLLQQIGLPFDVTAEQFKETFLGLIDTLSPEELVIWLEAGAAIQAVIAAQEEYNDVIGDAEQALQDAIDAQREAIKAYNDFVIGLRQEIRLGGLRDYPRQIALINLEFKDMAAELDRLAREAGMAGAATEDLILVYELTAQRINQVIAQMEQDIAGLVDLLFGDTARLEEINDLIREQQEIQRSGTRDVSAAQSNLYEEQVRAIEQIGRLVNDLLISDTLSPLKPLDRLSEAQRIFDELFAAAQAGDIDALQGVGAAGQDLISIARSVFASSSDFQSIFEDTLSSLQSLGVTGSPSDSLPRAIGREVTQGMSALIQERDAILARQRDAERQSNLLELALLLFDFSDATGTSIEALAEQFGFDLATFLDELGVSSIDDIVDQENTAANRQLDIIEGLDTIRDAIVNPDPGTINTVSLRDDDPLVRLLSQIRDNTNALLPMAADLEITADAVGDDKFGTDPEAVEILIDIAGKVGNRR